MKLDLTVWLLEGLKGAIVGLGKWILNGVLAGSYWICLWVAIVCLVLYIAGMKKAGKYVTVSMVIYVFLQCIKAVIL